jgi:hypothetical protein
MSTASPRNFLNRYHRDYYGGALMVLVGLGAVSMGVSYETGTLSRMGPGFFPVAVGAIIALMGALIATGARGEVREEGDEYQPPQWRGWLCIVASVVAFVVLGKYGGLLPATFAVVFIAALGDRQNTLRHAALLAAAMSVVCVVVFWWALQLQLPLFHWGH